MSIASALREKTTEPVKRNKDGVKWITHRYPIKGGISLLDAAIIDFAGMRNPVFDKLIKKEK